MSDKFEFELFDGLTLGEGDQATVHKHVIYKDLNAGEMCRAQSESEVPHCTADGVELVVSPSRLSRNLLRLSIRKIGDLDGISDASLNKLTG